MKSNNILAMSEQDNSADFTRFIDFFAEMIEKYGSKVLEEIEAEHNDNNISAHMESIHTEKSTA